MHTKVGQRGIALTAGFCHLLAYTIACLHPRCVVMVFVYILVGIANGAKNAAWNAFVSGLQQPNKLLGLLHGFYGLGATITPVTASALFSKHHWKWYQFYYLLVGMAALDVAASVSAFRTQSGVIYRMKVAKCKTSQTTACLRNKIVILCSLYLLSYVGSEVALGGWLVTFMAKVRHASEFQAGLTSSGLWCGITAGRIALGFVTGRLFRSEKHAVMAYLALAIVMHLLFWLVPNFVASAVFVALEGMVCSSPMPNSSFD
jgi:fucose permease